MSKEITNIIQNDSGGENPKSGIFEDKLWEVQFEDESPFRILGKIKMLEYLSKGTVPAKTVHEFKKWEIKTTLGHTIRTWVVVYDDKSHIQLTNKAFYSLITNGHKNKDEEKHQQLEEELLEKHNTAPVNPVLFEPEKDVTFQKPPSLTTPEEKEQLDMFRQQVREGTLNEN